MGQSKKSLPKFNKNSPLKSYRHPIGSRIVFQSTTMAFRGRALAVKKLRGVELKGVIVFEGLFFSDRRCEKGKAFYSNHQVLGCADRDEQMSNKVGA